MKKLVLAMAVSLVAFASQAASVKWNGTINGVDPAAVGFNGSYAANGSGVPGMSYVLTILSADGLSTIATKSGTVSSSTASVLFNDNAIVKSTEYQYKIVVTGTQSALTSKESATYDYSGATMEAILTGSFTTVAMGTTAFDANTESWKVDGIVEKGTPGPDPIPEPTTGLLVLVGAAGLALRRKAK